MATARKPPAGDSLKRLFAVDASNPPPGTAKRPLVNPRRIEDTLLEDE
jgi:hypothetical protein